MKTKIISVVSSLCFSGLVQAECPSSMNADQLTECIMIEGSGTNYQEWKRAYDQLGEEPTVKAKQVSSLSPEEISRIAPAAGKVKNWAGLLTAGLYIEQGKSSRVSPFVSAYQGDISRRRASITGAVSGRILRQI